MYLSVLAKGLKVQKISSVANWDFIVTWNDSLETTRVPASMHHATFY